MYIPYVVHTLYCIGLVCVVFLPVTGATSAGVANSDNTTSSCYTVNYQNYCFYTNGSLVLSWREAREFCAAMNRTLPIIIDEKIDNVFQQFISNEAHNVIPERSVWTGLHARPVRKNTPWHWINGRPSGLFICLTLKGSTTVHPP